jgi:hypothetical protein
MSESHRATSTPAYDVLVLGSGAAGLTAALAAASAGARVGVFEKADRLGGTTALSGGLAWVPNNAVARAEGVVDSREQALTYLESLSNATMRPEMVATFVDTADEFLAWLHAETPMRFRLVHRYPDYHPEHPGGLPGGGRSLEPDLFPTDQLGDWAQLLAGQTRRFLIGDIPSGGGTGVLEPEVAAERTAKGLEGLGRALVASLLKGCLEAGIEPRTRHRAVDLLFREGRVAGVRFETEQGTTDVSAHAVVVATGGFEWDPELVGAFLRGPLEHPPGARSNTGDGLRMLMRHGAKLGGMQQAWWVPVVTPTGATDADGTQTSILLLRERTVPGTIMVNQRGERFANEAANYNALGAAFHVFDPVTFSYANNPARLLMDRACVDAYGCFGVAPGAEPPEWLLRADTIEDLAGRIGVPPERLVATVERWNELVDSGHDTDFSRGESVYDGWCGDQSSYGTPRATLGRVAKGPFYAAQVHASALGTKGGALTGIEGEVRDVDGVDIPGLYAAGNAMAAPTGMAYGGAGGTLGPAMVFAYRTGRAAASTT